MRNQKIAALLPIVPRIAKRLAKHLPSHVDVDDLISAGNIAVINCADAFDPTQEASWQSYAGIRIHGAMIDYLREVDPVDRSVHNRARRLREARAEIEKKTKRPATRLEIAHRLGMGMDDLARFESTAIEHRLVSFDTPISDDDDDATLIEVIADESGNLNSWFDERALRQLLRRLPEREAKIIELYILEGWKFKEIGAHLGVTESRISQLVSQAIKRFDQKRQDLDTNDRPLPIIRPSIKAEKIVVAPAVVLPPPPATASDLRQQLTVLRARLAPPDPASLLREQLRRHATHLRAV